MTIFHLFAVIPQELLDGMPGIVLYTTCELYHQLMSDGIAQLVEYRFLILRPKGSSLSWGNFLSARWSAHYFSLLTAWRSGRYSFAPIFFSFIFYIFNPNIKYRSLHYSHKVIHCGSIQILCLQWPWNSFSWPNKSVGKLPTLWAYLCKIFYVLHPNANEMFQKK